ncbi:MAG: hypothetical protein Q8Q28_02070 [Pseudomonadota bacterium]|nr:hypothetical protein [Pseudomonadota bacterium]
MLLIQVKTYTARPILGAADAWGPGLIANVAGIAGNHHEYPAFLRVVIPA